MAFKTKKTNSKKPSSVISKNRTTIFSIGSSDAKSISYWDGIDKNGKNIYKYIPNTKANRDEINRLKGKPERHGKRLIWW